MKLVKQYGVSAAAGAAAPDIGVTRAGFQYSNKSAGREAPGGWGADEGAASITTLLRNQQFVFGYHNKVHRTLRQIVRIRL